MSSKRFDLTGRVAIVTGASRGIGKCIAIGLAEHSADLAICSRTKEQLEAVAKEIQSLGRKVLSLTLDMSDVSQFDGFVAETRKVFGHIDILVNNAAINYITPALEVDEEKWNKVMAVNVKGPFFLSQKVAKVMIEQGRGGSIINVTSEVANKADLAPFGAYGPSKAALNNVTKILANEWGKHKIRVNSLAPCFVKTEMNAPTFATGKFYPEKIKRVPLGRHSEPEDLIGAAVFLASDASNFVSGTTILVDGGFTTS